MRRVALPFATCILFCLIGAPAFAITRAWTGAVSANWSNPQNWSPQAVPSAGDSLTFPAGAANAVMTNDLPAGTSVGPMTFNAPYTLNGNGLTLTGDVTGIGGSGGALTCNVPLKIGVPLLLGGANGPYLQAIDVNGQTLTIEDNTSIAALNGSGTVNMLKDGSFVIFTGDGTFNGTINGNMAVNGSMPNADATTNTDVPFTPSAKISGTGTLGNATVTAGCILAPGFIPTMPTSVLRTKSLTLNDGAVFIEELAPGGVSDSVHVTGSVLLSGLLDVSIVSGSPSPGQTFTIIDNDGTDPVIGTFSSISGFSGTPVEGSTFTVGTSTFQISYKGGDGNDVVLTAVSATKSWTGAVSGNWSNPQNWSPQTVPAAGQALVFPAGAANPTMTNDLPAGSSVGAMTFNAAYTLNGIGLTLMGDVAGIGGPGGALTCNVPLRIGVPLLLGGANGPYLQAIDVNGQTLTIEENTSIAALNGSGTVNMLKDGSYVVFTGDGTFNGTINGNMAVNGSMPNANATTNTDVPFTPSAKISGTGTLGNATVTAGCILAPGNATMTTSVLRTKSLTLNPDSMFFEDLAPGGVSDSVHVTGSVSLSGLLEVSIVSGSPSPGQTFTIIDNDGTDPVIGTFSSIYGSSGIPVEGSTFTVGTSTFQISYKGGDGNDVVLTAVSATKSWTGAISGNWSNPQNWSPQTVPAAGQAVVFPAGAANPTMTNDLPAGSSVGAMTFNAAYTLNGIGLTLMGDVTGVGGPGGALTCNVPLKIGVPLLLGGANGPYLQAIDVNGQTMTIEANTSIAALNGSGTVNMLKDGSYVIFTGDGTFNGTINGNMAVNGSMPNANATTNTDVPFTPPAKISGTGTLGNATVTAGCILSPGNATMTTSVLRTKSLTLNDGAVFIEELAPGAVSDSVHVTGSVRLSGLFDVSIVSGFPVAGQTFTIIDNDGTDPVIGTFSSISGLSGTPVEGSTFPVGSAMFRISYAGGDGNDVVLTAIEPTATTLTQASTTTAFGDPITVTASVTAAHGTPAGSVTFLDSSTVLATTALQNGVATWTASDREVGDHNITATFAGTVLFAESASPATVHTVETRTTTATINTSATAPGYGDNVTFTAAVAPAGSVATPVGGTLSFEADGAVLGLATVSNGTASLIAPLLTAGAHSIVARYTGDAHFAASVSEGLALTIAKTQSDVRVSSLSNPATPGSVRLQVSVSAAGHFSVVPSGEVTVTEHGVVVGQEPLNGGEARVTVAGLSIGDHDLLATFSGDPNFEPASVSLTQTVVQAQLSISSLAVTEGDSGSRLVSLFAQLDGPSSQTVTVVYTTTDGSARAGLDYESSSGVVTFAPGEIVKQIDLRILGDTLAEPDQSFLVVLSDPTNASIANGIGTVMILNDDGPVTTAPRHRPFGH